MDFRFLKNEKSISTEKIFFATFCKYKYLVRDSNLRTPASHATVMTLKSVLTNRPKREPTSI